MSKAHEHLQQVRAALTAFNPQAAEESLRSFEDEIKTSGLTADAAALCQAELAEIRGLAEAAKDGVAAAQRQFREILELSRRLDTYDRSGNRKAEQVAPMATRKF